NRERGPGAERHPQIFRDAQPDEHLVEDGYDHRSAADPEHAGEETDQRAGRQQRDGKHDELGHGVHSLRSRMEAYQGAIAPNVKLITLARISTGSPLTDPACP